MNRSVAWIISVLLVLAVAAGGYGIYLNLEKVETNHEISFEGEARDNPLLAARIFLNRMGISAETKDSMHSIADLPDIKTTLLITAKRSSLSREKTEELYDWIENGGHLITRVTHESPFVDLLGTDEDVEDYSSGDNLQEMLDVEVMRREDIDDDDKHIHLKGSKKDLALDIESFLPIQIEDDFLGKDELITLKVHDNEFVFMLRRKIGNGMVTLVSDLRIINNRGIRSADHAELLWHLVNVENTPDNVWLIYNDDVPALWEILWQQAWALILSLTALLLIWLYSSSHRFGPLIPKESEDRRSLLEHIQASGNFYWKHQQKQKLIDSSRAALEDRLKVVNPSWRQLSNEEKIVHLSERFGLSQTTAHKLLFDQKVALKKTSADEFTDIVKQLEEIRNSI